MSRSPRHQCHIHRLVLILVVLIGWSTAVAAGDVHQALTDGQTDKAISLLKQDLTSIETQDDREMTALHVAAEQGNLVAVRWLLSQKANVNAIAYNKFTPLHFTTDGTIAEALIKAGANLDLTDSWGNTSLLHAAEDNAEAVVKAILATGYKLDLRTAIVLKKRDVVKQLLGDDPSLAKRSTKSMDLSRCNTPLGIACSQKDKEIVELLLKCGADVNETTFMPNGGCTVSALTNAVWAGDGEIVKLLLKHGATTGVSGGKRYPKILDFARKHSSPEIVSLLENSDK